MREEKLNVHHSANFLLKELSNTAMELQRVYKGVAHGGVLHIFRVDLLALINLI